MFSWRVVFDLYTWMYVARTYSQAFAIRPENGNQEFQIVFNEFDATVRCKFHE
jgi:hypothetical protein